MYKVRPFPLSAGYANTSWFTQFGLKAKIAARVAPPGLGDVLARIASALPGAVAGWLRWIRALKGEEVHQVPVDEVLYFQAQDKYTCVVTRVGEFLIRTALSDLAPQLDPSAFAQVHRSTLLNLNFVASTRRDLGGRVFVRLRDVAAHRASGVASLRPLVPSDVNPALGGMTRGGIEFPSWN